ncbi:hypothetical protein QQX98_002889 [Neonectria punicea]|uniref:Major facilitator superfamily (MFS) profile domain-containing protein n=1 Tax=Neonectria punicea TaxID=979145 RepID=A0ABR1HGD5_9HYPO
MAQSNSGPLLIQIQPHDSNDDPPEKSAVVGSDSRNNNVDTLTLGAPSSRGSSDIEKLDDQSQRLSFPRLIAAYLCLCLCCFISYLDMNSVTTSLPTISDALDAGLSITWAGTAYLLGQTSCQLLYGRISDITGRKPILLFSLGCVVVGGILSGFARSPIWLYTCRAISGVGGGGISSSVAIIVSDLVSLRSRGKYQGFISLAIGIGAAAGPFVAASLIQTRADGWRWVFWVPSIAAAGCSGLLLLFLPLKPVSGSMRDKIRKIDWLGVVTSMSGIVLTVISINSVGSLWSWHSATTISTLGIGAVLLIVFVVVEASVAKIPIIPLRLFKQRSPAQLFLTGILHDFVWQSTQYFVPLCFQTVLGYTPLKSATLILSFLLAQGVAGAVSGPVMAKLARYMPVLRAGFVLWTIGTGLKTMFNQHTHTATYVVILALEGAGVGWVHQPGLVALQANSRDEDRAVATGTRNVLRSFGGVVGIAVSTAGYYAVLDKALQHNRTVPDWLRGRVLDGTWSIGDEGTDQFGSDILDARMSGFRVVVFMSVPLIALCLIASVFIADIILKGGAEPEPTEKDEEK